MLCVDEPDLVKEVSVCASVVKEFLAINLS